MARAEAEAIAKATYAATRDPADVALFYMGLGRKSLLQVSDHGFAAFMPQPVQYLTVQSCSASFGGRCRLSSDSNQPPSASQILNCEKPSCAATEAMTALQGLLRSSQQVKLADFLNRDFSETRNQEAACKNAFVLLGQHRHAMAAAFFLLGASSPVRLNRFTVCIECLITTLNPYVGQEL